MARRVVCFLAVTAAVSFPLWADATPEFDILRIVGTGDALPGTDWQYATSSQPSLSDGNLALHITGMDPDDNGIYLYSNGVLELHARTGAEHPGGMGIVRGLSSPRLNGTDMVYAASWYDEGNSGDSTTELLQFTGGVTRFVNPPDGTLLPGAPTDTEFIQRREFTNSVDGVMILNLRSVTFDRERWDGLYRFEDGVYSLIGDESMAIPGTNGIPFGSENTLHYDGDYIAVVAGTSFATTGLISYDGTDWLLYGTFADIAADWGVSSFGTNSGGPKFSDGNFAIAVQTSATNEAIYLVNEFGIDRLVDTNTIAPDGGRFIEVGASIAIHGDEVLFTGMTTLQNGARSLYRTFNGAIAEIVSVGDVLDGRTIAQVRFADEGLSGDSMAFEAIFTDGTQGIYLAPVVRGSDQIVPVISVEEFVNGVLFDDVQTQAWVDSLLLSNFELEVVEDPFDVRSDPTLITAVELPVGYGESIEIFVEDHSLGIFGSGDRIDVVSLLGEGVSSLSFEGFEIPNERLGAEGVPVFLEFDSAMASIRALKDLIGDIDSDGFVGVSDLDMILANWGDANTTVDLDGSGSVDQGDLDIIIANWGSGEPPTGIIPEPGTLAIVGLGGLALLRRRRCQTPTSPTP